MRALFKCKIVTPTLVLVYLMAGIFDVSAADYPNRTITLVVPYPPGGGVDGVARVVAAGMSAAFKQPVIVDNRGGAGGAIGTRAVAHAEPDGYTLLLGHTGTLSIIPSLYAHAGYDPRKDFAAVGMIASMPMALIANPTFPAQSVADFIALAKQHPGKLDLGTSSTSAYMGAELFMAAAGINAVIIRHNGTASLINNLIGGHIPVAFSVLSPALGNIRAGTLRAIAVSSAKRSSLLPDVPTFNEAGLTGFEAVQHYGLLAPAGTPKEIVDKLSGALRKLAETPEVQMQIRNAGGDLLTSTPAEYAAYIEDELAKWSALARKLNLKVD